jgi:hypothetical protein
MSNQKKSAYQGASQGGDTNFRKEWDTQEYAQKAREREAEVKRKGTFEILIRKRPTSHLFE